MAALTADWTVQWAGQLADLADQIIQEIPDKEEWGTVRTFISNISRMLRQGDVRAGFRAVLRVLPYVQRALSSAEKCSNIHSTFELTKSIYRHFLVDDCHRKNLENLIEGIRSKMSELRRRMEKLTISLDKILDDVICRGESLSWWGVLKLAFEINRISALIKTCEDRLTTVRCLLDDLESHVAAKSFMAYIFTYITFIIGLVFSASGNVPVGAACISAAGVSRKAAKSLDTYREQLASIDSNHRQLQEELTEWKHKFAAEKRNFLLLFGPQKALTTLVVIVTIIFLIGKTASYILSASFLAVLLLKSQATASNIYTIALLVGGAAFWMEGQFHYALFCFNSLVCASVFANYIGVSDFWW